MREVIQAAAICFALVACGGDEMTTPPPAPPALGAIDPALAGLWLGSVAGGLGNDTLTMELGLDATIVAGGPDGSPYCTARGRWGVRGGIFEARASDCTRTMIEFGASTSTINLSGRWIASSGVSGTFNVDKQP